MTANELAYAIQYCGDGGYNLDAANMIRQQQAEIEALKKELALQRLSDIGQAIEFNEDTESYVIGKNEDRESAIYATGYWNGIAKVKPRELTDEEIDKIIKQHDWYSKTWVDMVRSIESAILKKASEK